MVVGSTLINSTKSALLETPFSLGKLIWECWDNAHNVWYSEEVTEGTQNYFPGKFISLSLKEELNKWSDFSSFFSATPIFQKRKKGKKDSHSNVIAKKCNHLDEEAEQSWLTNVTTFTNDIFPFRHFRSRFFSADFEPAKKVAVFSMVKLEAKMLSSCIGP